MLSKDEMTEQLLELPEEVLLDALLGVAREDLFNYGIHCSRENIHTLAAAHRELLAHGYLADPNRVFGLEPERQAA